MLKKHVFVSLNLNNSEIFRLSFEDIFLGTLDTYTKKINPPSAARGGGGCTVRSAGSEPTKLDMISLHLRLETAPETLEPVALPRFTLRVLG